VTSQLGSTVQNGVPVGGVVKQGQANGPLGLVYTGVSFTNYGSAPITGTLRVVLQGLSAGVSLQYAAVTVNGVTTNLAAYISYTAAGDPVITIPRSVLAALAPGQKMIVSLRFRRPAGVAINYNPLLFSDPFA
jgi:hypothetical protein